MRVSWVVCVLLGTLAWGQAAQSAPPPAQASAAPVDTSASVPADAPVLTIAGVCAEKTAAASTSADCKTVITKAEFEKLANALVPNATPQQKKQLASVLPRLLAMAKQAKERGMDQTEQYAQTLEYVKMQVLSNQLQRTLQDEAANISDADIEKYYKDNPDAFDQYNLDRIFVPRTKQGVEAEAAEDDEKNDKLTAQQKKAKEEAEKAKAQKSEEAMTKLADSLRARAVAGEDIAKLQKEAFDAAGMKIESPTVNLPSVRRNGLPQPHVVVFDLKPGEVSQVITDAGGHYIYKMNSKSTMPLDQAKNEIHGKIQNDRMREKIDKLNASFSSVSNEAYFGPGGAAPIPPPRMPRPRPGTPGTPAAQPSSGQAPAPQKD